MTVLDTPDQRAALQALLVLGAADIDALPWQPVPGCPGVAQKELWRFDSYVEALIRLEPGATTPGAPHLAAHHHIWVVSGSATIAGHPVGPSSYLHVPPGAWHPFEDVGPQGCVVLQMHRPHPPREAEALVAP